MARSPHRVQSALVSNLWFSICNDHTRSPKVRRFQSQAELRQIIADFEKSIEERTDKYLDEFLGEHGVTWEGKSLDGLPNETKGDLGVLRDLYSLDALGYHKAAVNQVNGEDYDIHAFNDEAEVQIESKNIRCDTPLSMDWIADKMDRFPRSEDRKAVSGQLVRVVTIPTFTPNKTDRTLARRLLKQRGIHVLKTRKQVLSVSEAKDSSKVVQSKLSRLVSKR